MNGKEEYVYVVDIFGDVFQKVSDELNININYVYGDAIDILRNLKDKDTSIFQKDEKYVLAAVYIPFIERRGGTMLYADITIRRITIAMLSNKDDEPPARYANVFKPVLYPVYYSFLKWFARDNHISSKDPNTIVHTKTDLIGNNPISGINDFVDCINLDNFNFLINQSKYC